MCNKRWTKISGKRGSWFGDVAWDDETAENLPIAHAHYWNGRDSYHDPHFFTERGPRFAEWIAAAREKGRVIVSKDEVTGPHPEGRGVLFARTGYIGVFDITNVTETGGLRFQLTGRYGQVL